MTMKPEWKDKWLTALRSGEFQQAAHSLHDWHTHGYCCLGVLCKIAGTRFEVVEDDEGCETVEVYSVNALSDGNEMLSPEGCDYFGLTDDEMHTLAAMNDGSSITNEDGTVVKLPRHSFAEIADHIEEAL